MGNGLLLCALLFCQSEFVLVVDDGDHSKLLMQELYVYDFSYNEDGRVIGYIQEQLREKYIVVHHLDLPNLRKYGIKRPEEYPAVRIGRYKQYDYFPELGFGSRSYAILSLKQITERNWAEIAISEWEVKCRSLKRKNDGDYYQDVIQYVQSTPHGVFAYEAFDDFTLENCIKEMGHLPNFPKKKEIRLPRKPAVGFFPWQESFELSPVVFTQIKPHQPPRE